MKDFIIIVIFIGMLVFTLVSPFYARIRQLNETIAFQVSYRQLIKARTGYCERVLKGSVSKEEFDFYRSGQSLVGIGRNEE